MSNHCMTIKPKLLMYVNKHLSAHEVSTVVEHLATCKECQRELASLLQLKRNLKKTVRVIPKEIKHHAFDKIYKQETGDLMKTTQISKEVNELLSRSIPSLNLSSKLLTLMVSPIKDSINLLNNYKGGQHYVRS